MKFLRLCSLKALTICSAIGMLGCAATEANVPYMDHGQALISKDCHKHRGPRGPRGPRGHRGHHGQDGINGINGKDGSASIASGQSLSLSPVGEGQDALTLRSDPLSSEPADIILHQIPLGLTGAVVTSPDVTFDANGFTINTGGTYLLVYGFTAVAGPGYITQSLASPPTLYSYITPALVRDNATIGIGSVPLTLANIALKWSGPTFQPVTASGQCLYSFLPGDKVFLGLVFQAATETNLHLNNSVFIDSVNRNNVGGTLTLIKLGD